MPDIMEIEPAYQEALDYLYRFVDFSLQKTFRYSPDQFELGRMRDLMAALGNPEMDYPIIHIAGTKGKGSVASMCASVLHCAGYRTGLYTSPHLQDYAERIQIDGQPMAHQELVDLVDELKPIIESIPKITTFEITTALAYTYFKRKQANAAVVEVGLGGRLDATNVCTPIVSVITSLSYDHTYLLGNTLAEIAGEKGGIIKPGVPVVLAPQQDEARQVIERISSERNAPLVQVGQDYLFTLITRSLEGQTLLVWPASDQARQEVLPASGDANKIEPTRLTIPLLGFHQVENAATAYAALMVAQAKGLTVGDGAIQQGFSQVAWPGRFEVLQRTPPVVVDSAHNRDSALKLRLALDDYFPGSPVILLFGASEDKDISGMFAELMPRVSQVVATKSIHPRAIDPEKLVELAQQYGRPAKAVSEIEQALAVALEIADSKGIVLATGSIFVAAAVREVWQAQFGEKRLQLSRNNL